MDNKFYIPKNDNPVFKILGFPKQPMLHFITGNSEIVRSCLISEELKRLGIKTEAGVQHNYVKLFEDEDGPVFTIQKINTNRIVG
jgi:hypothetical protein